MFIHRITGFVLLIAVLSVIFFWLPWGGIVYLVAAPAMTAMAYYECASMLKNSGHPIFPRSGAAVHWIMMVSMLSLFLFSGLTSDCGHGARSTCSFIPVCALILFWLPVLLVLAGWARICRKEDTCLQETLNGVGLTALMFPIFGAFLLTYFIHPVGYWLFFLCLVTKATDTGGYIAGSLTAKLPGGNHKIAPNISPKKSWEGLFFGIILSMLTGFLFWKYGVGGSLAWHLAAALMLALGSFFGDLTESAVKRLCGVKDSGAWIPGMGGAFDVLDSFIYNGILFWILYYFGRMVN